MASSKEDDSSSSLMPTLGKLDDETEAQCNYCGEDYQQPRLLSCLHVYCEQCLNKMLLEKADEKNDSEESIRTDDLIVCPTCNQETKVPKQGAGSLPVDYTKCNTNNPTKLEEENIVCTSCKTKKIAVARCLDCTNFLCSSCVTAHKYMRCFENHKVESFQDIDEFIKPVPCVLHSGEVLKYYCYDCEYPFCNECLGDHKLPDHHYKLIFDDEQKHRDDLKNLMVESKSKVQFCEDACSTLENLLSELQLQHDNCRSHVEETYQSFKAALEKIKNEKVQELDQMHQQQEMAVMETYNSVEKTIERIEDGCKFTTKLLEKANLTEILLLKSVVGSQLLSLINNTPKPDVSIGLHFETDPLKFETVLKDTFGDFRKIDHDVKTTNPSPSVHSSYDGDLFSFSNGMLNSEGASAVVPNVDLTATSFPDFTLNTFSQLASIADMTQSSNSQLSLADIISTDTLVTSNINTLNNLTALAKLGSVSLNNQDPLMLNEPVVSGLSLDGNVPTHSTNSSSSPNSLQPPPLASLEATANALGALLNGGLSSPHGLSSRGSSPHMDGNVMGSLNGSLQLSSVLANTLLGPGGSDMMSRFSVSQGNPSSPKLNPVKIRYKFGQLGPSKGQFSSPHGFCLGLDDEIVVADTNNHRIQIFEKTGDFKYQFGIPGKEEGQLWYPRKVAVMRNSGKFVVCDRGNERSRMQIFNKNGHFIKKIAIRYIDIVAGLAITNQGYIVAVDSVSPTVFIIAESGDLLRWFDCSDYMREPSDIAINGDEFFVCDFKGHCVVVFSDDGQFLRRIGCENITNYPNGIDISDHGDVLVGDSHGNRFHVAVFSRDGSLLSEYECPYVKVSRCCGLKITPEGYVVTLAKNNHHVLILNTLYLP
ncbi:hypothetical protein CHUAL_003013 [Chamberlinius hualienensis]